MGKTLDPKRCLFLLILLTLAVLSCKKSDAPQRTAQQNDNPYAGTSVIEEVNNALKKDPQDGEAWYHLADLYDRSGQYPEAIEAYKKVIALKPDMGYAYVKMGTAYDRLNRPREAVETLQKAIRRMPDNPVAYNNLGVAYGKLGRTAEEIRVLRKAIQLRPRYASARYNLGMAYVKTGNRKAAQQEYESLKRMDAGIADALFKEMQRASRS
jgi:tetratricopeptide (TPR) repeat protein